MADHNAHAFSKHDTEVLEDLVRLVERELHLGDMIRQQDEQLRTQSLLMESQKEKELLYAQPAQEKERPKPFC